MLRSRHGRRPGPGRYTADIEGDFFVFLVGMQINSLWRVHKWLRPLREGMSVAADMRKNPPRGLLAHRTTVLNWGFQLILYWRTFEDLERFANDPRSRHLGHVRRYYRDTWNDCELGTWHELYRIAPDRYECIYANIPELGLAEAGRRVPVSGVGQTAAARIGLSRAGETAAPAPGTTPSEARSSER